jgi:rod shape-determining protein MreD
MPVKLFGLQLPEPVFAMAAAFAWAVIRPSILPPLALLGLGLFQDLLWGGPLGLWPLCLLLVYALGYGVRPILSGQGFVALGVWYGVATFLGFALGLGLMVSVAGEWPSLIGLAAQLAATWALYPLCWRLIDRFEDAEMRFR